MSKARASALSDEIRSLYLDQKLSINEISQKLDLGRKTVGGVLKGMGITRSHSEALRVRRDKGWYPVPEVSKEVLEDLYVTQNLTPFAIARTLNTSSHTARRLLEKYSFVVGPKDRSLSRMRSYIQGRFIHPQQGKKGELSWNWKGGRILRRNRRSGAVHVFLKCPEHPRAGANGYVAEHILVWEEFHRELLPQDWHVHHLNGDGEDNRPENLLGLPSKAHAHVIPKLQERIKELENLVSNDLLTRFFNTQRSLMEKYKDIEDRTGLLPTRRIPVDLDSYKGQERVRQAMWNIVAELGELAEGLNYKPWKLEPSPVDKGYLYKEVGDLIHFVLELLILMGVGPNNIEDIYFRMVRKNIDRQESGY